MKIASTPICDDSRGYDTAFERATANLFVEPQYAVYKYGARVPHSQIYAGLSLQF